MQDNSGTFEDADGFLQTKDEDETSYPQTQTPDFLDSNNELPSFDTINEKTNVDDNDISDVPLPPPNLRARNHPLRLEDIEDKYLEEQSSIEEMAFLKIKGVQKGIKGVFVNVKDYNNLIVTVKESRSDFKLSSEKSQNIDNLSATMGAELFKIQKTLESIQRRLIGIDNRLFEKLEDE